MPKAAATTTESASAEAVSEVVHDIQARVAALRLAATTLKQPSIDDETRDYLLVTADQETVRLSTELAGVSALAKCFADRSAPGELDLAATLREAAGLTARSDARIRVEGTKPVPARGRARALGAGLPIILQVVADVDGEAVASAASESGRAVVRVRRGDGTPVGRSRLLARLIEGIGATPVETEDGLAFSLPGAGS
jgi:hypothetical protein